MADLMLSLIAMFIIFMIIDFIPRLIDRKKIKKEEKYR
jgi:Na+/proline symporter